MNATIVRAFRSANPWFVVVRARGSAIASHPGLADCSEAGTFPERQGDLAGPTYG
jgi:hypothetical protein